MSEAVKASDYLIEGLLKETLYHVALAELIVAFPFLGLPIIKQVLTFFLDRYTTILTSKIAIIAAFKIIDAETDHEIKMLKGATLVLKQSIESKDPAEIEKAKNEFKNRLGILIRIIP